MCNKCGKEKDLSDFYSQDKRKVMVLDTYIIDLTAKNVLRRMPRNGVMRIQMHMKKVPRNGFKVKRVLSLTEEGSRDVEITVDGMSG